MTEKKTIFNIFAHIFLICALFACFAVHVNAETENCSVSSCEGNYENGFCTQDISHIKEPLKNGMIYEISNAGELFWFADAVNNGNDTISARLVADIDLENRKWREISFAGNFDGGYHIIKNMSVMGRGFFGTLYDGAEISSLGFENADVYNISDGYTGILAGETVGCVTVRDCYTLGSVGGVESKTGGIIGKASSDTKVVNAFTLAECSIAKCDTGAELTNVFSSADITAQMFASGLIAYLFYIECGEHRWHQKLGGGGDPYPHFKSSAGRVYAFCNGSDIVYKNEEIPSSHSLTYDVSGNRVTEKCKAEGCQHFAEAEIVLSDGFPDGIFYTSYPIEPCDILYSDSWLGGKLALEYTENINCGKAHAIISTEGGCADFEFDICRCELEFTMELQHITKDGMLDSEGYTVIGLLPKHKIGFMHFVPKYSGIFVLDFIIFDEGKRDVTNNYFVKEGGDIGYYHEYDGNAYQSGGTQHYNTCSSCDVHLNTSSCAGGTPKCEEKAICSVCGNAYGDVLSHNMTSPTCTEYGVCLNGCGKKISPSGHAKGEGNSGKCKYCERYLVARIESKYYISFAEAFSDAESGDGVTALMSTDEPLLIPDGVVLFGEKSEFYGEIENCGIIRSGVFIADIYNHGTMENSGDIVLGANAEVINYGEIICSSHFGGSAGCTALAECLLCGMEYGELAPHKYKDSLDRDCDVCGAVREVSSNDETGFDINYIIPILSALVIFVCALVAVRVIKIKKG